MKLGAVYVAQKAAAVVPKELSHSLAKPNVSLIHLQLTQKLTIPSLAGGFCNVRKRNDCLG